MKSVFFASLLFVFGAAHAEVVTFSADADVNCQNQSTGSYDGSNRTGVKQYTLTLTPDPLLAPSLSANQNIDVTAAGINYRFQINILETSPGTYNLSIQIHKIVNGQELSVENPTYLLNLKSSQLPDLIARGSNTTVQTANGPANVTPILVLNPVQ